MKCAILSLFVLVALIGNSLCLKALKRRKLRRRKVNAPPYWKNNVVDSFLGLNIPGYAITSKQPIGEGGFGYVIKGSYNGTNVAIKFIYISDQAIQTLTDNEIEHTKKACQRSKFSLPICDKNKFFVGNYLTYSMTFPFAVGDLSKELIHTKVGYPLRGNILFPIKRIKTVIQMVMGVREMHLRNQIIHRDIKPENFLRMPDERVVVADYGLSIFNHDANYETGVAGTPGYIPGDYKAWFSLETGFDLTDKVDVFALGITMAEYLIPELSKYLKQTFDYFKDAHNNLGDSFYDEAKELKKNFERNYGKYMIDTDKQLLNLIFDYMIVPDKHFFDFLSKRISIGEVYDKLTEIFPELSSEVYKTYNTHINYCNTQHNQGYHPQHNQGYHPQHNQGYHPQHNQGYHPQHNQGYHPQHNQGYHPQHNQGYHRQHNQGYNTQHNQGYNTQHNQGYHRQHNQGYNTQHNQGYHRQHNQGY